ncbi:MAG: PDZ domain-containing protein, partial [Actinomycetia bacterium]|nr:PDZ domain-containing protein [Actinomycetes bacterium]
MRVASPDNLPVIDKVDPSGIAAQAGINAKDKVVSLNGRELRDVIDYEMLRIEDVLEFKLLRRDQILTVSIENTSGFPLGIYFEKSIFDKEK